MMENERNLQLLRIDLENCINALATHVAVARTYAQQCTGTMQACQAIMPEYIETAYKSIQACKRCIEHCKKHQNTLNLPIDEEDLNACLNALQACITNLEKSIQRCSQNSNNNCAAAIVKSIEYCQEAIDACKRLHNRRDDLG